MHMYKETDVIKIASNEEGDILTMTVITGNGEDWRPGVTRLRIRLSLMRAVASYLLGPVTAKHIETGYGQTPVRITLIVTRCNHAIREIQREKKKKKKKKMR